MKYIIEIEDMPLGLYDKDTNTIFPRELYRAKGFDKFIFDQEDLDKLQIFDSDLAYNEAHGEGYLDGYQQGLKKAWDAVKRIFVEPECGGYPTDIIHEIYGEKATPRTIILGLSAEEAVKKIDEYREKYRNEHKYTVGDEVTFYDGSDKFKAVLIDEADQPDYWVVLTENGCIDTFSEGLLLRTGKHYYYIDGLLEEIRGENEKEKTS